MFLYFENSKNISDSALLNKQICHTDHVILFIDVLVSIEAQNALWIMLELKHVEFMQHD